MSYFNDVTDGLEARRADAAHLYRERHRKLVNEQARLRMRRKREEIRQGSSDLQLEHRIRARLYRRTYRARRKQRQNNSSGPPRPPASDKSSDSSDETERETRKALDFHRLKFGPHMVLISGKLFCL
ncbi:hypothetical protein R3P38DRAFT_3187388 [Favolaschia claudopus]|uniref:Uncharacterized protein n=1 Tax=Favolaschia claudopus TaxID=2862362 RepID=A0AAW0AWL2_9AGAR